MSGLRLVVLDGPGRGTSFELSGTVVVGRDETAGVVIDDSEVSRRHATFSATTDEVEVEDLGSKNGTWIGGRRIEEPCKIAVGEKVRMGRTLFRLVSPSADTREVKEGSPPQATPDVD